MELQIDTGRLDEIRDDQFPLRQAHMPQGECESQKEYKAYDVRRN
jgi:hypothetical protein